MADRIQQRRDTAARWTQYNPILLEGEVGYELDTDQYKVGDGVHAWNDLPYRGDPCVQQVGSSTTTPISQDAATKLVPRFNVSQWFTNDVANDPFNGTNAFTKAQALSKLPTELKKQGVEMIFLNSATGAWEVYRCNTLNRNARVNDSNAWVKIESLALNVIVSSKNLFNPNKALKDWYVDNSGNISSKPGWSISGLIPVTVGLSYVISAKVMSRTTGLVWLDKNLNLVSNDSTTPLQGSVWTAPSGASYMCFNIASATGTPASQWKDVQVEQSTTGVATAYEPYMTLEQASVEGLVDALASIGVDTTTIKASLEVLQKFDEAYNYGDFDTANWVNQNRLQDNCFMNMGNGTITENYANYCVTPYYIPLRGLNLYYRFTRNIAFYDENFKFISGYDKPQMSLEQVPSPEGAVYCRVSIPMSSKTEGFVGATEKYLSQFLPIPGKDGVFIDYVRVRDEADRSAADIVKIYPLVRGFGVERISSNNLLNPENAVLGKYITADGTTYSDYPILDTTDFLPVEPNSTYVYGVNPQYSQSNNGFRKVAFYDINKNSLPASFIDGDTLTFTTPADAAYVKVSCYNGNPPSVVNLRSLFDQAMYLQGTEEDWKPYGGSYLPTLEFGSGTNPNSVISRKDLGGLEVIEYVSPNILNPANASEGFYVNSNGSLSVYPSVDTSDFIPVKPNTTYYYKEKEKLSVVPSSFRKVAFYDINKNSLPASFIGVDTLTFTTPADAAYVKVSAYNGQAGGTVRLRTLSDVGIVESDNTPFEPFGSSTEIIQPYKSVSPNGLVRWKDLGGLEDENVQILTVQNSDKILFTGCSYDESTYSLKFKSWINKLSNYIDWQCGNHGVSGQRIIDIAVRLRKDQSTYNIIPSEYKPTYITIANNGNEYLPTNGRNLDLYSEQLRIAQEYIKQLGAELILGTSHHVDGNPWVESDFKSRAEELGIPYMGIGWLGEQIMSHAYQGFWGGSHPGSRTNSFVWLEWLYFFTQMKNPRKVVKVFRPRTAGTDIDSVNYDDNIQRAQFWQEINCGERSLNESNGSEDYYDRLNEGTTVDPNDENNIITNYTGQTNNNEYVNLIRGTNVAFTDKALVELIIDQVGVDYLNAKIGASEGITWYVKDNNNESTWERIVRDAGTVFQVTKEVYDGFNETVGTKFTTSKVANGTIQMAYWGKVKSWTMGGGYYLCMTLDTSSTDKQSGAGTLNKVGSSTTYAYTNQKTPYRYSYDFFSRILKPKGKFVEVPATYEDGLYTIELLDGKYFEYDKVKLIAVKSGAFNISSITAEYKGGKPKVYKTKEIKQKREGQELLPTRGFTDTWTTDGGWTDGGNVLKSMPADVRSYPPYLTTNTHVALSFDSDGFPRPIVHSFTIDSARGYRTVKIRAVVRLFPLIFNTDKTGEWFTNTPQITKTSYDNALLCCEVGNGSKVPAIIKRIVDTDWAEVEFDTVIPPFLSDFKISLYRCSELGFVSPSSNWEMQLADVSVQLMDL